jgi:hypothetical protein
VVDGVKQVHLGGIDRSGEEQVFVGEGQEGDFPRPWYLAPFHSIQQRSDLGVVPRLAPVSEKNEAIAVPGFREACHQVGGVAPDASCAVNVSEGSSVQSDSYFFQYPSLTL